VLPRALADEVGADPGRLRIGLWTEAFNGSPVDPESAAAAIAACELLEAMGHHVERSAPAVYSDEQLWEVAKQALAATAAAEAAAWEPRIGHALGEADLEPRTWGMVQAGQAMSAVDVLHVIERMQGFARTAFEWFGQFDLVVTPTTAAPASLHGDYLKNYVSGLGSAFTRPLNLTGQPTISVPLGWPDDGLPRGVQLIADYGREDVLIRVASALEAARPWAQRRPPV
jgi:amidase